MSTIQNTNTQRTIENISEIPKKNSHFHKISKVTKNEKI